MRLTLAVLALAGSALIAPGAAFAQTAEDAFGTWKHPDNGSHISVYQCGGGLCAKVVKVADPNRKDDKNPDAKLRTRPVVGVVIMNGGKKTGANSWAGKLYNTQDGQTYSGTVTVVSKNSLKLEGCVMGGLICQGPTWTRIN
jgi:uncharacterized protein (DUF2147 family)